MAGLRGRRTQEDRHRAPSTLLKKLERKDANAPVHSALYSQLGHKGDLMLIHFRDSLEALNHVELDAGADAALRLSRVCAIRMFRWLSWACTSRRARPMRPRRPRIRGALAGMECGDCGVARARRRSHGAAAVSRRSRREISLLLSHGPQARRAGELVHRALCRAAAHDARARADRPRDTPTR